MKKFYIVPHSHLDREWYRTFQENRIKLTHFMDDLLDTLDNDPDYKHYLLDAQTSFMDDYFEIRGDQKDRFKKYVQAGVTPIGPWYVQPDEHLPTAEGIIRNLLISKNISDQYGDFLKLGYVPDSFGQSSSFPTLLKGFGIDTALFYRGFSEDMCDHNEFIWEGIDGSQIVASWMPIGYGNAMFFKEDDDQANIAVIEENIALLTERNISDNYLLMCGSDQSYVKKFLPSVVERLNQLYQEKGLDYEFIIARPDQYMDEIKQYSDKMQIVSGELRKGKRSRTHNSIGATRLDIKKQNADIENKYLKVLEPLESLSSLIGIKSDADIIHRGWKYIVESHAHDSLCCCCTDIIHKEIIMRMVYADQIAEYIMNEKFIKLHDMIRYNSDLGRPILLFSSYLGKRTTYTNVDIYVKDKNFAIYDKTGNEIIYKINSVEPFNLKDTKVSFTPVPDDFYDKINISLYASVDGYGYETIYIKEGISPTEQTDKLVSNHQLENKYLKLTVEENGAWTILDKQTGKVFENQHIIIDDGNAGDEYDYSPSYNDQRISSLGSLISVDVNEDTPLEASLKLLYKLSVPSDTTNECRSDELVDITIETVVTLTNESRYLGIKTKINNTAKNHRLQVLFDGGELINTNMADVQLGEIIRENEFAQTQESVEQNWHERYYPVFNQHKYAGLRTKDDDGFVILNKGLPQYEVYNQDTTKLAITIMNCVGAMGNVDLKYRPGRRSGSADLTPDSQMLGEFTCEYAFLPIQEGFDYIQEAETYVNPLYAISYPEYDNQGSLPDTLQLASSSSGLLATTLKPSEDKSGYILRVLNPYTHPLSDATVQVNRFLFKEIINVDLAEDMIENKLVCVKKLNNPDGSDLSVMSGNIQIKEVNHNQMLSFKLKS